jgi:hypothetical protein
MHTPLILLYIFTPRLYIYLRCHIRIPNETWWCFHASRKCKNKKNCQKLDFYPRRFLKYIKIYQLRKSCAEKNLLNFPSTFSHFYGNVKSTFRLLFSFSLHTITSNCVRPLHFLLYPDSVSISTYSGYYYTVKYEIYTYGLGYYSNSLTYIHFGPRMKERLYQA